MNNLLKSASLKAMQSNVRTVELILELSLSRAKEADEAISVTNSLSGAVGAALDLQQKLKEAQVLVDAILALSRTQAYVTE